MSGFFITGTDTDCGKTIITCALLHKLQSAGVKVNVMKPVAAGVSDYPQGALNDDVVQLMQQTAIVSEYDQVNPYLFKPAIAPHIAAQQQQIVIDPAVILQAYAQLQERADITLVEGAGGWLVPLTAKLDVSDIPCFLNLPVVLVVGLKLGCINHARLTLASIQSKGCIVSGWIGTQVDADMACLDENVKTLKEYLNVPCMGIVPFMEEPKVSAVSSYLYIDTFSK